MTAHSRKWSFVLRKVCGPYLTRSSERCSRSMAKQHNEPSGELACALHRSTSETRYPWLTHARETSGFREASLSPSVFSPQICHVRPTDNHPDCLYHTAR